MSDTVPARTSSVAQTWFEEVWNRRQEEAIDRLAEPSAFTHLETGTGRGLAAFRKVREELLVGLPDMRVEIEDLVVQGENEVVRWRASGTHRGPFMGIEASGRLVVFEGMTWLKVRQGRIYEGWDRWNFGGFLAQLSAVAPVSGDARPG